MRDWKPVYLNYIKLLRSLAIDSNTRFSEKSKNYFKITYKLHSLIFHIFWTVYCNSNNADMATSLAKRSKTFFVEFICMSHDVRPIDENFEEAVSDGFQFSIKNTIGEFKCCSKKKLPNFNLVDNSSNIVSKFLYIFHKNQINIEEEIVLTIANNIYTEKNFQGFLDDFLNLLEKKTTKNVRLTLLVFSILIKDGKIDNVDFSNIINNIENLEKVPKTPKELISFAETFAANY